MDLFDVMPDDMPYPIKLGSYCKEYKSKVNLLITEKNVRHIWYEDSMLMLLVWHHCPYCKHAHTFEVEVSGAGKEDKLASLNKPCILYVSVSDETYYFKEYKWKCPWCGQNYRDSHIGGTVMCKKCKKLLPDIHSMVEGDEEDKLLYHRHGGEEND